MKTNAKARGTGPRTFEGGPASPQKPLEMLRRTVMSCLLWEDNFYEDGEAVADRIKNLVKACVAKGQALDVFNLALEAKNEQKLRHTPLWILVALFENHIATAPQVEALIQRADEPAELLAMWWKDGKRPIPKQMKIGIGEALRKFDAYQLAKYDRDGAIKIRDVFRLVRPKPKDQTQSDLWKLAVARSLPIPGTWENELSAGKDKKETWTRLILEEKLGDLAFLRNLRNMEKVEVDPTVIRRSFEGRSWKKILPFQMVTAVKYAPRYIDELDKAFLAAASDLPKIQGFVRILVDQSGSMSSPISSKGELARSSAAASLAAILREMTSDVEIYGFDESVRAYTPYHGFALVNQLDRSMGGTTMWAAIQQTAVKRARLTIVVTDEQTTDAGKPSDANADLLVVVNVATNKNGVGYGPGSVHISGWSENVARYVSALLN